MIAQNVATTVAVTGTATEDIARRAAVIGAILTDTIMRRQSSSCFANCLSFQTSRHLKKVAAFFYVCIFLPLIALCGWNIWE